MQVARLKESLNFIESATQSYSELLWFLRDTEEEADESKEPSSLDRFVAIKIVK